MGNILFVGWLLGNIWGHLGRSVGMEAVKVQWTGVRSTAVVQSFIGMIPHGKWEGREA